MVDDKNIKTNLDSVKKRREQKKVKVGGINDIEIREMFLEEVASIREASLIMDRK